MVNRKALARRIMRGMPGLRFDQAYQMVHLVQTEIRLCVIEGEEVRITDFGVYKPHELKPRRHKLPNGEWATTATTATVKFKPAPGFLKELGSKGVRARRRG